MWGLNLPSLPSSGGVIKIRLANILHFDDHGICLIDYGVAVRKYSAVDLVKFSEQRKKIVGQSDYTNAIKWTIYRDIEMLTRAIFSGSEIR